MALPSFVVDDRFHAIFSFGATHQAPLGTIGHQFLDTLLYKASDINSFLQDSTPQIQDSWTSCEILRFTP